MKDIEKVVYIAELDADVDDVMAAEYLFRMGALQAVVLDPIPKTKEGNDRLDELTKLGILTYYRIPDNTKYVFCGGSLTQVAAHIKNFPLKALVMNGGFVGCNIVERPLSKFQGKETVRTFNFNCNVRAADEVLRSTAIQDIILIGKNVCHSGKNTIKGVWKGDKVVEDLMQKYHVRENKKLHDILACHEGLVYLGDIDDPYYTRLENVKPFNEGLNGNMTLWGSKRLTEFTHTPYRAVRSAVSWS